MIKAIKKAKLEYPSICYDCALARRIVEVDNEGTLKGWVGCYVKVNFESDYHRLPTKHADGIAQGLVYLKSNLKLNIKKCSDIANNRLITKGVKECSYFDNRK